MGEAALVIFSYVLGDLYLLELISKDVDCCGAVGLWGSFGFSLYLCGWHDKEDG